ncbi:MAG: radical SAM family heme chaperone HemW [Caldilineaceae bacterium]|nr:radical SAM family heme chaperone HemW [Caldilineaceae bacterium]
MSFTPALGLYIHIPFCARKCPYCDFNTYAGLESLHDTTVDALCIEMERWGPRLAGRTVSTVFVGGGTPTVLTAAQLERIFGAVHRCFTVDAGAEITCEANPGTVDQAKFGVLRSLGVNRLSMGVQSFQPAELHFLGRIHSVEDVGQAFATARKAGFDNINLDFIFGLPGQTEASWCDTLERALALAPEHLSLYSLIVEPNTPLFHWVENGSVPEPDEDQAALHYERAMERLAAGGYIQYEVSNWARRTGACRDDETPELASRHNLIYWRNDDYLGIGPGAHSHLRTEEGGVQVERRWGNRKPVPSYGKRMRAGDSVEDFAEEITPPVGMGETMMLGLRLVREGVPLDRFTALHGRSLSDAFGTEVDRLCGDGLLTVDARRVRLTPRGLMVGNRVFAQFLPDN